MDGEFNATLWKGGRALLNQRVCRLLNFNGAIKEYVFRVIQEKLKEIEEKTYAVTVKHISSKQILSIEIPLPPLHIQEEIVSEIESYQKIIDGARQVVENYKPRIDIDPEWEMVTIGEIIKLSSGSFLTAQNMKDGPYSVYGGNGINGYHNKYNQAEPTIIIGRVGAYCGSIHISEPKSWITDNALYISDFLRKVNLKYLAQIFKQLNFNQFAKIGGQPSISQKTITELKAPYPSIEIQHQLATKIEKEETMINSNQQLIEIFEQKIKDRIAKVWGE
jgi:restriction endonuclease S subunit